MIGCFAGAALLCSVDECFGGKDRECCSAFHRHWQDVPGNLSGPSSWTKFIQKQVSLLKVGSGQMSRKASAEIRGEFFRTKSRVNFAGDFLVDYFWPFSLGKIGGKNPPKNPRQNSNRNLGVLEPKSTLQESGLDKWGRTHMGSDLSAPKSHNRNR